MLSSGFGKYLAPTSLGLGYAIIKIITLRLLDSDLAIFQDMTYQFLGGILLGFALRPISIMIYWKWNTSILFFSLFLLVLGPFGQIFRKIIWGIKLDNNFWFLLLPEITAALGIKKKQIILDPGMGFFISGKKKYSFKVINRISEFHEFGIPLLLGPSKKSFLSNVTRGEFLNFEERDIPCTVVSSFALWRGVSILRYHEVNQGRHLIDTIELMKRNLK